MESLIWIACGAGIAGFVQGLSGFAFGLVAMSVWAWTLEPQLAAAMAVCGAFSGQLLAVFTVRRSFDVRLLAPYLVGGMAGIPIGAAVLPLLDAHLFQACLGALLVVWCPLMLFSSRISVVRLGGQAADGIAGLLGGVAGGLGGFTGVIPTLWCTLRAMDKDKQRAIIQNFNLATLAMTLATYLGTGVITTDMLPLIVVVVLAMALPAYIGAVTYVGIGEATFRKIVLTLLTGSGVALLSSSVPELLARGSS